MGSLLRCSANWVREAPSQTCCSAATEHTWTESSQSSGQGLSWEIPKGGGVGTPGMSPQSAHSVSECTA